jgi:uncharacterized protein DUF1236
MQFQLTRIAPLMVSAFFNVGLASAQTGVIQPDRAHPEVDTRHPTLPDFTMQQRAIIYRAVVADIKEKGATPLPIDMHIGVGTKLPEAAKLYPLPDAVAKQISAAKKYNFAVWGSNVLVVDPSKKTVTDILNGYILQGLTD